MDIVVRKGQQNIDILLGNAPLTLLVPAALLFVIVVLARPTSWGSRALQRSYDEAPTLRAGLIALVTTLTIGFLINDSGVAIPAVGATLAVPLIVSVVVCPADRGGPVRGHDPRRTPAAMTTHPQREPDPRRDPPADTERQVLDGRRHAEHSPRHVGEREGDEPDEGDEVDHPGQQGGQRAPDDAGRTTAASRARPARRPDRGTR